MERFTYPRRKDWLIRWVEFMKDSLDLAPDLKVDWHSEGLTCISWACDGTEVLTGHNPFDPFVGSFDNMLGAAKVIRQRGYSTLDDLVADLFEEVPLGMAQTGDWVLTYAPALDGEAALIMPHAVALAEPPFYYALTPDGLGKGDLYKDGVRAFAVGRSI